MLHYHDLHVHTLHPVQSLIAHIQLNCAPSSGHKGRENHFCFIFNTMNCSLVSLALVQS